MPITRTAMIDDDGSGTTGTILNNAWKQELYTQIDGLIVVGSWTPVDASGAGLVFGYAAGRYWRSGGLVMVTAQVNYPVTASGAAAKIGGLPVAPRDVTAGLFGLVNTFTYRVLTGGTVIDILQAATGVSATNTNVSGAGCVFSGVYLTA
jgi:hypothetical protein